MWWNYRTVWLSNLDWDIQKILEKIYDEVIFIIKGFLSTK